MFAAVVLTVVLSVPTVCGEAPLTATFCVRIAVPEQSLLSYALNVTVPARLPPCGALIVAESFGMNDCADVIDDFTEVTTTSSSVLVQSALCVTPLVLGRSPSYDATQW